MSTTSPISRVAIVVATLLGLVVTGLPADAVTSGTGPARTAVETPSARRAAAAPTITPATPGVGDPVSATGRLPTKVRRTATLELRQGTRWTTAGRTRTTTSGRYRISATAPTAAGPAEWRIRAPKARVRIAGRTRVYPALTTAVRTIRVSAPAVAPQTPVAPSVPPTPPPAARSTRYCAAPVTGVQVRATPLVLHVAARPVGAAGGGVGGTLGATGVCGATAGADTRIVRTAVVRAG